MLVCVAGELPPIPAPPRPCGNARALSAPAKTTARTAILRRKPLLIDVITHAEQ